MPEPDKRAAAEPPQTKIADTKTERPPRVKKRPVPDAGPEPADDLILLLPTVLPVLAVAILLIVAIVYLVRRASSPKEGQYYRDFIQDLSVSGVFIKARQMFEPGQQIMMTFMSPFLQKPFKISGEIVRTLDTGIGVTFDKESQVQTEAISSLMDQIRTVEESG